MCIFHFCDPCYILTFDDIQALPNGKSLSTSFYLPLVEKVEGVTKRRMENHVKSKVQ